MDSLLDECRSKHVTYVEGVWFDEAITGRSSKEIGIPATPSRSFTLAQGDTALQLFSVAIYQ
jgi:hypothetical protein